MNCCFPKELNFFGIYVDLLCAVMGRKVGSHVLILHHKCSPRILDPGDGRVTQNLDELWVTYLNQTNHLDGIHLEKNWKCKTILGPFVKQILKVSQIALCVLISAQMYSLA